MFSLTSFLHFAGGFSNCFLVKAETDWGFREGFRARIFEPVGRGFGNDRLHREPLSITCLAFANKTSVFSCYVVCNTTCIPIFKAMFLTNFFVVLVLFLLFRYCFAFIIYSFSKYFIGKEHTKLNISNIDIYNKKMIKYLLKKREKKINAQKNRQERNT